MPSDAMTNPPHAPAGLKYARGYAGRFWVRTDSASFRNLFALHFAVVLDALHVNAFRVHGYLGEFAFDWSQADHATKLLLSTQVSPQARVLFGQLISTGLGEWLLCNAPDADSAKSSIDAKYVGHRCLSESATYGRAGVYFISNGRGAVKIGKSHNCMEKRYITIQIANPDPLRVVAVIANPSPDALEKAIHEALGAVRIRGEWFAMSDAEAVEMAVRHGGAAVDFS